MENKINLLQATNPYLSYFQLAQRNLNQLIKEERLLKRVQKSRRPAKHD
jgi:hypothetical protein